MYMTMYYEITVVSGLGLVLYKRREERWAAAAASLSPEGWRGRDKAVSGPS